jgi:general secretion pathway protein C
MITPRPASWSVRGATFAVWLLAAGSAAYWGLKLGSDAQAIGRPLASPRTQAPADPQAIATLLGGSPSGPVALAATPTPALASRFNLVGVVAEARSGGGAALISVDGKPARPYRVGAQVDEGLVLQSVQGRRAVLAAPAGGVPVVTLELPPLKEPSAGQPITPNAAPR